jgi:hypothetical protein
MQTSIFSQGNRAWLKFDLQKGLIYCYCSKQICNEKLLKHLVENLNDGLTPLKVTQKKKSSCLFFQGSVKIPKKHFFPYQQLMPSFVCWKVFVKNKDY